MHTLGNYTYGLNSFNVSIVFGHFRQEMKFCSFLEKNPKSSTDPKEKLMSGDWCKKMYPLKFGSCPAFYEITVFSFVINQSDRPEPRKELHRITKSFSINGLY